MFDNIYKSRSLHIGAAFSLLLALLSLTACSSGKPLEPTLFHAETGTPDHFIICHGYGCQLKSDVQLTQGEWEAAIAPFSSPPEGARAERHALAKTIANIEQIVGIKTGTDIDKPGATIAGYGTYQLDCIDETINTNFYLEMLSDHKLMRFHRITTPARRGNFYDGRWPHNTAVIEEIENGKIYAVDSWFDKNGAPPHIVPLEQWLSGWRPE